MSWGPIDENWGSGWEDFDVNPFEGSTTTAGVLAEPRPRPAPPKRRRSAATRRTAPPTPPRRAAVRARTAQRRVDPVVRSPEPSRPGGPRPRLRVVRPPRQTRPEPARTRRAGRTNVVGASIARNRLFRAILALVLVAVVGQLVRLQVVEPDRYVEVGEAQRLRIVPLDADRGRILDRNEHDLALSVLRPTVFADPGQIDDPAAVASLLAPLLRVDTASLTAKLSADSRFVYLDRRIDDALAARIVELDLDGIHLLQEPDRHTPSGQLGRSVVGRVATDQTGSTGMEYIYDETLTGTPGSVRYERARDGGTIASAGESRVPARAGDDVILTLDRSLQYEAERLLAARVAAVGAKGGVVIVSDPRTGELLAMANIVETEDGDIVPSSANLAVTDMFEPGSVNKVITIAAALEEGLVEADTELVVPWRLQVADHEFSDDHSHPTDPLTVTQILAQSSNIGTIMIGQELGKERIDGYLRAFGFGSKTALDFPNEASGLLLDPDNWSGTSIGSIPIGQGIAVTALQMLSAYNVIANDGVYVEPRLVAATVDADGARTPAAANRPRRVVSAETAKTVRSMLSEAVDTGTGTRAQVPGYTVAGKTGTARKPQDTGTYRDLAGNYHYVAAFTGMVPAEDPALSIIVVVDEPTATIYGGTAAAPVFADLAKFALARFRIPPAGPTG